MPGDSEAPQASATTIPPAPAVLKPSKAPKERGARVPEGFVQVTIPARYGAVYVKGPDGKEREFKGGQVAVVSERQAKGWGALPTTAPVEGVPGEAKVEEAGVDKAPTS